MKKQNKILQGILIALPVMGFFLVMTGCNAQPSSKAPSVDIHTAVLNGDKKAVQQHIAVRTNINEKDPVGGSSPLIIAALFGKTEIAKILLEAGVDINQQNNDGSTALHTAAFFCRPEIVQLLLSNKAVKTIKNKYGQTAIETVSGSFESVQPVYESLGKMLAPMGLKIDLNYLKNTRPQIVQLLK
ncbi:ankyrin repeat domain-containing protein [Flavihumibacter sp. UBA7668]|uniref:ankyrin repeat domain-containing protein n=1 Tax=Flavihumibacter sp. UBA7668 TaxID=1946542 RepID=UPI0025C560F1|nr:ankyrin repeat domain-containing protein [Flavihumibacter sp. UBA7668]